MATIRTNPLTITIKQITNIATFLGTLILAAFKVFTFVLFDYAVVGLIIKLLTFALNQILQIGCIGYWARFLKLISRFVI